MIEVLGKLIMGASAAFAIFSVVTVMVKLVRDAWADRGHISEVAWFVAAMACYGLAKLLGAAQ